MPHDCAFPSEFHAMHENCQGVWQIQLFSTAAAFDALLKAMASGADPEPDAVVAAERMAQFASRISQSETDCLGCLSRFRLPDFMPGILAVLTPHAAQADKVAAFGLCEACSDRLPDMQAGLVFIRDTVAGYLRAKIRTLQIHAQAGHA